MSKTQKTKNPTKRLTFKDRVIIETRYCTDKWSMQKIAKELNRYTSVVSKEIMGKPRFGMGHYRASVSQKNRDLQVKKQGTKKKLDTNEKLRDYVIEKLKMNWSCEQISLRLPIDFPDDLSMRISYESIYFYVYSQIHREGHGTLKPGCNDLRSFLVRRHKVRTRKGFRKAQKLARSESLPCITERPEEVESRSRIGDFEGDTIVCKTNEVRIKSLNERMSGIVFFTKALNGTCNACNDVITHRLSVIPKEFRHTLTQDRGTENRDHKRVEKELGIDCYYAHAYSSYERGSNENTNGLLRRYLPKGTNFSRVSEDTISMIEFKLNSRPRKRLGGLTPYEVFYQKTGIKLELLR